MPFTFEKNNHNKIPSPEELKIASLAELEKRLVSANLEFGRKRSQIKEAKGQRLQELEERQKLLREEIDLLNTTGMYLETGSKISLISLEK